MSNKKNNNDYVAKDIDPNQSTGSLVVGGKTYTDIPVTVLAAFDQYMQRTETSTKRIYSINKDTGQKELVQIIETDTHPTTRDAIQYMRNLFPQYFDRVAWVQTEKLRAQIKLIEGGGDDSGKLLAEIRQAFDDRNYKDVTDD